MISGLRLPAAALRPFSAISSLSPGHAITGKHVEMRAAAKLEKVGAPNDERAPGDRRVDARRLPIPTDYSVFWIATEFLSGLAQVPN